MKAPQNGLILTATLMFVGILAFQNCAKLETETISLNRLGKNSTDLNKKSIWTLNRRFISQMKLVFYVNPTLFHSDTDYGWFYKLNGIDNHCSISNYENYLHAVEIECSKSGVLEITAYVIHPNFTSEKLRVSVVLEDRSNSGPLTDQDIRLRNEELVLNMDGTPGPAYSGPNPEFPFPQGPDNSGAQLYAARCTSCHGALANSTKRGRTAQQIRAAIGSQPSMTSLDFLSEAQLRLIANALK